MLNLVKLGFGFFTVIIVFFGFLLNSIEKYLPIFIVRSFKYGKCCYKGDKAKIIGKIEVPKSWFKHFYVFSSVLCLMVLVVVFSSYVLNVPVPLWLRYIIETLGGDTNYKVASASTLLAMLLLTIQCCRRFYDTHFVSIFSPKSRMNLSHYMVGYLHYLGAVLAILVEAPNFSLSSNKIYYFRWSDISQYDMFATVLFLWACLHQYKVTVILANLRKNAKGKVVCDGHYLPEGDWFKYVSSPHNLAEVLMYLALTIILWRNSTWMYVFFWVLSNQVETALLTHWWYQDTFPKYPQERKAIIPFLL